MNTNEPFSSKLTQKVNSLNERLDEKLRSYFSYNIIRELSVFAPWLLALMGVLVVFNQFVLVSINMSESLPGRVYVVSKWQKDIVKGQPITFIYGGEIYPHRTVMTKLVVGVPGDVVTRVGREYFINGASVGIAKTHSLSNEPLIMSEQLGVIPDGKFWYATPHKDSFDSRYAAAGLGSIQDVVGTPYSVF